MPHRSRPCSWLGHALRALTLAAAAGAAAGAAGCRGDAPEARGGAPEPARRGEAGPADVRSAAGHACPSFAYGAITQVADVPGGVVVTVRARDPEVVEDVRARARLLAGLVATRPSSLERSAADGCPIVAQRTTLLPADVEGGVQVLVLSQLAEDEAWLRREAHGRQHGLSAQDRRAPAEAMP